MTPDKAPAMTSTPAAKDRASFERIESLGESIYQCIGDIRRGANVTPPEIWNACERLDTLMGVVREALARKPALPVPGVALDPEDSNTQVALQTLKSLNDNLKVNLHVARAVGLEVSVTPELEAAYAAEYGNEGQRNLDVLLGRAETVGSVNVKMHMMLEDRGQS